MCTLVILPRGGNSYLLAMNRDESPARPEAGLIETAECDGVKWISPRDARAHGTWIGLNAYGVTLCLLNQHPAGFARGERVFRTRGEIIPRAIAARTGAEAMTKLRGLDPTDYPPFLVVAVDPAGGRIELLRSDGRVSRRESVARNAWLMASSALREAEVLANRRNVFAEFLAGRAEPSAADLREFMASHAPEKGSVSVCLHRSDARTLSLTEIEVAAGSRSLRYIEGQPCESLAKIGLSENL